MCFLHGVSTIMDFQWFDDLAAVQVTGHFSLAAQKSHISQPALSRRIKALEDWAGFLLVDRRSRPARLTPAGEQILDVALSSFKRLTDERNILQQSNLMADQYVVRFDAQHSVAWRFFPDWLQGFENSFGPIMSRLRVRAWNGSGVSWLPQSLIAADLQTGVLCQAGADQWDIGLTINLMRLSRKQDSQLDHIWQHVKTTASAKQSPLT